MARAPDPRSVTALRFYHASWRLSIYDGPVNAAVPSHYLRIPDAQTWFFKSDILGDDKAHPTLSLDDEETQINESPMHGAWGFRKLDVVDASYWRVCDIDGFAVFAPMLHVGSVAMLLIVYAPLSGQDG